MLDIRQLHKHVRVLEEGDETARRQTLQALLQHDQEDWDAVASQANSSLVKALLGQLDEKTQPIARKETVIILGNMGAQARSALPQLIALLNKGVPEPVREAAVTALGNMGREAKAAVDPLVQLLGN